MKIKAPSHFSIYIFILIAFQPLGAAVSLDELDAVNERAKTAYLRGDFKEAIETLEPSVDEFALQKELSSELFYNLALSYWAENKAPQTMLNLYKSILYNPSMTSQLEDLSLAQEIHSQKKLGSQKVDKLIASALFISSDARLMWVGAMGLWILFLSLLAWLVKKKGIFHLTLCTALVILCVCVSMGIFARFHHLGVIYRASVDQRPIYLYRSPIKSPQEQIVELQPGSLAVIKLVQDEFVFIESPLPGWVSKNEIQNLSAQRNQMQVKHRLLRGGLSFFLPPSRHPQPQSGKQRI